MLTNPQLLLRKFRNAQRRTLYWSGLPSYSPHRTKQTSSMELDRHYSMALGDQKSLAKTLCAFGIHVMVRDYKSDFIQSISRNR